MIEYSREPTSKIDFKEKSISCFLSGEDQNIDQKTVDSFGHEWTFFDAFSDEEIEKIGDDYFDVVSDMDLGDASVLDVGCGSGRWSKYLCSKVKFIEAIDPSAAVFTASRMLGNEANVRVSRATVGDLPFADQSFDMVMSLGVLHHIPDTGHALRKCVEKAKIGGVVLIYLYYNLDNRGIVYRFIFKLSAVFRFVISKLPVLVKKWVCNSIAFLVYWPFSRFSGFLDRIGLHKLSSQFPLFYYHDKSIQILKNDAFDRFGTPLEQRFSKKDITEMMEGAGLERLKFSERTPYWHAVGYRVS